MPDPGNATHSTDVSIVLFRVVDLLAAAGRGLWARAAAEGPLAATYSLAQEVDLTADLAASLIPGDAEDHRSLADHTSTSGDQLAMLAEAEALLRSRPIECLPAGTSQLLVRLGDLIRQERP